MNKWRWVFYIKKNMISIHLQKNTCQNIWLLGNTGHEQIIQKTCELPAKKNWVLFLLESILTIFELQINLYMLCMNEMFLSGSKISIPN